MKKEEKTKLWNDAFECGRQETIGEYERKVSILRADIKSKNALRIINNVFPVVGKKEEVYCDFCKGKCYHDYPVRFDYEKGKYVLKKSVVGKKE